MILRPGNDDEHPTRRSPVADILALSEMLGVVESDEQILLRIGQVLTSVVPVDCASLYLFDHGLTRAIAHTRVGLLPEEMARLAGVEDVSPLDIAVERFVIEHRRPIERTGPADFERFPDAAPGQINGKLRDLIVPLAIGERVLGVAYLWRRDSDEPYTTEQIDVAAAIARHAALGLLASRHVARLEALNVIGRRLSETSDIEALYQVIFESVSSVLPTDALAIALLDTDTNTVDFPFFYTREVGRIRGYRKPLDDGATARVLRDGMSKLYSHASEHPTGMTRPNWPDPIAIESSIHVPLISGGSVFGALSAQSSTPNAYSTADVEILETIASQVAVAIENAHALAAANANLARVSLLNRISDAVSASLDVGDICASLDRALSLEFGTDAFYVWLLPDSVDDQHEPRVIYRRSAEQFDSERLEERLISAADAALHHAEPQIVIDAFDLPRLGEDGPTASRSMAIVPLRTGDTPLGVIGMVACRTNAWNAEDARVLATVGRSAALAIENARLYDDVASERLTIGRLAVWQHALLEGGRIITQGSDISSMIDAIARQLELMLRHDSFAVYTLDAQRASLRTALVRAGGRSLEAHWELPRGTGLNWAAVDAAAPLLINDSHLDPRSFYPGVDGIDPRKGEHCMAAPLIVEGRTIGSVSVARAAGDRFSQQEFELFSAFTPHLAIALQTAQLVEQNRSIHISTIRALTAIIDTKDPLTSGHSQRVADYARRIAGELGFSAADQRTVELAGLLHDIGKVGIPDDILAKPGPLTPDQRTVMMAHPVLGADILRATNAPELLPIIPLVRHHHERYQGGGYPDGLSGSDIPFGAAIIAVAEAYDMLTTDRPYRGAEHPLAALAEVIGNAGTQFHPRATAALESVVRRDLQIAKPEVPSGTITPVEPRSSRTPMEIRPISVLHRLASAISSIRDIDAFLDSAVRIISAELHYPNVTILLPTDNGSQLVVRAGTNGGDDPAIRGAIPTEGTVPGWVFQHGVAVNVGESGPVPRFGRDGRAPASQLAVPLMVESNVVGVVNVESPVAGAFSAIDERILTVIAAQLAPAVELARVHDQVKRAAQRDGLTGIFNHASFYARLEEVLDRGQRVAVMIFDVEGLKRVNDTAGHLTGDHVLRRVAMALELETRPEDTVARYGGDEFAVIVTGVGHDEAVEMAGRLQAAVNRLTWGVSQELVRISVGVAVADGPGWKATELVAVADQRMYQARARERGGRAIPRKTERRRTSRRAASDAAD